MSAAIAMAISPATAADTDLPTAVLFVVLLVDFAAIAALAYLLFISARGLARLLLRLVR
ncbi:hypothetical protein [Methylobacterium sp. R2-1]|uniref:hypothetical protein n=1 Tax=Methylobacterium sp. R2-1 TaxID=2587064 RepID=UPI00160D9C0E|nr:hypothetical protein [Methylobacterium sp. R2-1]MBB2960408.1 hypothetical protein [Methylobacterium sp. R2-1]